MARLNLLSSLVPACLISILVALLGPVMGGSFPLALEGTAESPGDLVRRGATLGEPIVWPNGTIPYTLKGLPHSLSQKIRGAMRVWEQQTCVRFVPKEPAHGAWIRYTKHNNGCWSRLGYQGDKSGETEVNLDLPNLFLRIISLGMYQACGGDAIPVRQLGIVLGLIPEQQRSDRELFVHVIIHNVVDSHKWQMEALPDTDNTQPYDYDSVMHAPARAFGKNLGLRKTIESRNKSRKISPNKSPTLSDLRAVNRVYHCPDEKDLYMPACVNIAPPLQGKETTSITFVVDERTVTWMRLHGYDSFGVARICGFQREWWGARGSVPLGDSPGGRTHPFTMGVLPRCQASHVTRYYLYLCKGAASCMSCFGNEDGRRVCPLSYQEPTHLKAVVVTDTKLWICHRM